jgi:hypothetical protein
MSDYDRGPYTPQSDRLSFDPRQPVRGGPAPVTLIVSALVLVAIIGGVFLVYRHGTRHKGPPDVVGAPIADIKTPAPPASANVAPAGLVIDKSDTASNAAPAFAPPPEQPLPRPAAIAPEPPPPPPKPVVASAAAPPAATPVQAAPVHAAAPAAATPAPVAVAVAAPKPAAVPPHGKTLTIASLTDAAMHPAKGPPAKPLAPKPSAKPQPSLDATIAAATAPHPSTAAATAAGANWAQIGALSSPTLAEKAWTDAAKIEPAAMAGKGRQVQPANVNGKTYYRAFVTGFPTHAAAEAFCAKLKAEAKPCIVH